MRMLNGRVYGRKRPYNQASTNPFATVRSAEPEFVEWGYGGMGSNKSNTNSSMGSAWKVVQNGSNSSTYGNDEDDSSGMAWVKKRRAERERAKLEAEKQDQEHGDVGLEEPQPTIIEEEERETPQLPNKDDIPLPPVDTPAVVPAEQAHGQPQHVTTTINLPPQRPHKREASFGHRIQVPPPESPKEKPPFGVDVFNMDLSERPEVAPEIPEASTASASEAEEDSSSSDEEEEDSDTYSEVCIPYFSVHVALTNLGWLQQENARSKTALGAGVEKVSRLKDTPRPKTPNSSHSPLKNQLPVVAIEA